MTKAKSAAPDMRELTVVYRDPASLTDYENNSRTHSPEQIEKLRASIREFGFTNPILLKNDDTTIGAGHARNMAALERCLGFQRRPALERAALHWLAIERNFGRAVPPETCRRASRNSSPPHSLIHRSMQRQLA